MSEKEEDFEFRQIIIKKFVDQHFELKRPYKILDNFIFPYYQEDYRKYHNLNHINKCIDKLYFEFNYAGVVAWNEVALAIWFHDLVYNTHRNDNEKRSADIAQMVLIASGLNETSAERISKMILATTHTSNDGSCLSFDTKVLLDIDLSSLAENEKQFDIDGQNIREEYEWVPDNIFYPKRKEFLSSMLKRKRIYFTDVGYDKYEEKARTNLERTIKNL